MTDKQSPDDYQAYPTVQGIQRQILRITSKQADALEVLSDEEIFQFQTVFNNIVTILTKGEA